MDRPCTAGGRAVDANWHVLARITTSDGVQGTGYIAYPRRDLMTVIAHAARELGEHLVGTTVRAGRLLSSTGLPCPAPTTRRMSL